MQVCLGVGTVLYQRFLCLDLSVHPLKFIRNKRTSLQQFFLGVKFYIFIVKYFQSLMSENP